LRKGQSCGSCTAANLTYTSITCVATSTTGAALACIAACAYSTVSSSGTFTALNTLRTLNSNVSI